MNRAVCALCCLVALVPSALAGSCYYPSYSYSYPTYSYPVVKQVVEKVYKVVPVAAFVPTPVYFGTSAPPAAKAAPAAAPAPAAPTPAAAPAAAPAAYTGPSQADWKALVASIQAVNQRLDRVERYHAERGAYPGPAAQPPQPAREAAPPPMPRAPNGAAAAPPAAPAAKHGLGILSNRCAVCHDKGAADQKGGKHVLLDGGRLVATPALRLRGVRAIVSGRMPVDHAGQPVPLQDDEAGPAIEALSNGN